MSRKIVEPEITAGGTNGEGFRYKHPAYAQLSFARVQHGGTGAELYGTSIKSNNTIVMRLTHSEMDRTLGRDWFFSKGLIAEIEMSQSQFAEAITSLNIGGGVPVTLRFSEKDGEIPDCVFENKRTQFKREFDEHVNETMKDTVDLIDNVSEMFENKKSLTKTDKQEILSVLNKIRSNIGTNVKFMAEQFDEQLDKSVNEAKGEVESFTQNRINSIAGATIAAQQGIINTDAGVKLLEDTQSE